MTAAAHNIASGSQMLDFALDYASRGWHVFPCWPGDKSPCVGNDKDERGNRIPKTGGLYKATTDATQIKTWWRTWPTAMIGVRMGETSGVWAIDPDAPKNSGDVDGRTSWSNLVIKNGAVHTHTHLTPGGGEHLLFKWDASRPIGNKEGALKGKGINVRGEGGYVIAPPSINSNGLSYEVREPLDFFRFETAPDWLYDLIQMPSISEQASAKVQRPAEKSARARRPYADAALRRECDELAGCGNGDRNNQLNKAAFKLGTLVGAGELSEGEVIGALFDAATACGLVADDGQRATMATIDSGLKEGIKRPREIPERVQTAENSTKRENADSGQGDSGASPIIELFWHGKNYNRPIRSWLVKDLIPETGRGLASGQWGAAKTFGMIDLAGSLMTATPFAGREICRQGGVLFIAAEGASEVPIRLQGMVEHKLRPDALAAAAGGQPIAGDLESLPFAWIEECPNLKDAANFARIVALAKQAAVNLKEQFDLPLVMIIIDTYSAAANIEDGNKDSEGQFMFNLFGELSRQTGAFVLAVDHFGKMVETGTRGTSAKEAASDVVLAFLAEREVNGTVSNTRMAVRKLRGGSTGMETPFDLKVVSLGDDQTTCVIEWRNTDVPGKKGTGSKDRWPQSLRVLRASVQNAMVGDGKLVQPFGGDGPTVRAVPAASVKAEFTARYPADSETGGNAKRMAYTRALKQAVDKGLICSREIAGIDHLWLPDGKDDLHTTGTNEHDTP